jgi:hypothetical protein
MIAVLVWLAGCAFGIWVIFHYGYDREMIAFAVCTSVLFWIVGGASWIGQKLKAGGAVRGAGGPRAGAPGVMRSTDADREALKKTASQQHSDSPHV